MLLRFPSYAFLQACAFLTRQFRHFVFDDFNFIGFLIVMLVIDTITGVRASLIRRTHNSRQFRQVFSKLADYAVVLVIAHVLTAFEVDGKPVLEDHTFFVLAGKVLKGGIYLGLLWTEAKSIDENLRRAGGAGLPFPTWFRRMMADLDERGPAALQQHPLPNSSEEALPAPADPDSVTSNSSVG